MKIILVIVSSAHVTRRHGRLGNLGMGTNGQYRDGLSWLGGDDPRHRDHVACRIADFMGLMFYSSRHGYDEGASDLSDKDRR